MSQNSLQRERQLLRSQVIESTQKEVLAGMTVSDLSKKIQEMMDICDNRNKTGAEEKRDFQYMTPGNYWQIHINEC